MAVLLPTQLTTTLEYVSFTSTHNFYSDALGLTSVSVTVSSVTWYAKNTSLLLVVVGNNNVNNLTTGQALGVGSTITFSGKHQSNFDQEFWKYRRNKSDSSTYVVASPDLLPGQYFSLWNYTPDTRPTTTISVVVATNVGSFTLTQTVYNNWDYERDRMKTYVGYGQVVLKKISKYLGY